MTISSSTSVSHSAMDGPTTMLLLSLALLSIAGHSWSAPVQCLCSHELKDRDLDFTLQDDLYIAGQVMDVMTAKTRLICGALCSSRDFCKTFNFQRDAGRCELTSDLSTEVTPVPRPGFILGQARVCSQGEATLCADFACPNTSRIMVETQSGFCVSPDCPGLVPPGANYRLKPGESRLTEGTVVGVATRDPVHCPVDKVSPVNETVVCGYNGTWSLPSSSQCRRPSSCADVKLCDPTYSSGEYWLYPAVFGSQTKVKVYCHEEQAEMKEYVTMPALNWAASVGITPVNRSCTDFFQAMIANFGNVTFHKFALVSLQFLLGFPRSSENPFTSGVGPVWFFWNADCLGSIDSQGFYHCTNMDHGGFLFNSTLSGYIIEYNPPILVKGLNGLLLEAHYSLDKRVLYASCAGSCVICAALKTRLLPDPDYVPPDSEATFCQCPL